MRMGEQWERARVDAKIDGDTIASRRPTSRRCDVTFDPGLAPFAAGTRPRSMIDGDRIDAAAPSRATIRFDAGLVRTGGAWKLGSCPPPASAKLTGLQGPIDDAFMEPFVFVRPTGKPFSRVAGQVGAGAGRLRDRANGCISSAASRA